MMQQNVDQELFTIHDFIRWGTSEFNRHDLFYGHGLSQSLDEAVYLTLFAVNLPQNIEPSYWQCRVTSEEKMRILDLFQRRIEERLPAAYLTNESWFCGLPFYVDERTLVPRSPIAELIQSHFEAFIEPTKVGAILDLCTGSGCIATACSVAFPEALVDGVDISSDALDVAEINRQEYEAQCPNLNFFESDLFSEVHTRYDVIVSNPPYVDAEDMSDLPDEFLREPELGLAAGEDGLALVIPMLEQARNYLTDEGVLIVEVGNSMYALAERFPEVPFHWIEFKHGGIGVFMLTAAQLDTYF